MKTVKGISRAVFGLSAILIILGMLLAGCTAPAPAPTTKPVAPPAATTPAPVSPPPATTPAPAPVPPKAVSPPASVTITPVEATNAVKTQHTFTANVKRADGTPADNTEVQWFLNRFPTAVGDIVEGTAINKIDNTYAKTTTDSTGNAKVVITSTREGDTDITAFVPAITDASKHKVFATKHWVDLLADFPQNGVDKVGTQHVFNVKVYRASTGVPLRNVEVRWTITSNSPAAYFQGFGQVVTTVPVMTDAQGMASVTLLQVAPIVGENLLRVDVVSADGVKLYGKDISQKWVAPTLNVTKTGPATVDINTDFAYTIRVRNDGTVSATNVTLTDIFPEGLTFVSSVPPVIPAGQVLNWNIGGIAAGQTVDVVVKFRGNKTGQWINRANVNSAEGMKGEASAPVTITGEAKLGITKTAPATATKGDVVRYNIVISNTGKVPANNTVVTETLPEGLTYIQAAPWAATIEGNIARFNLLTIPVGESRNMWIEFSVNAASGTIKNTVRVTATDAAPAEASATFEIRKPGISITKTGPAALSLDGAAQYVITVKNNGDVALTNLVVEDTLPVQLQHVTSDPGPILAGASLRWNIPSLNVGDSRVFTVNTKAVAIGTFDNVATVTSSQGVTANAKATSTVTSYGLAVTKTGMATYYLNSQATFNLTVTNTGKSELTNVRVVDTLPTAMAYVSSTPAGTASGSQITWNIATLAAGATQQIAVVCRSAQVGPFENTVAVTSAQGATASARLTGTVTFFTGVDLTNRDTVDPVAVGTNTTYEITVNNQGGVLAVHNLQVSVLLPNLGAFVSAEGPSTFTQSAGTVTFNPVPELAAGKSLVFKVTVRATTAGAAICRATVTYDEFALPVSAEQGTTFY
jgi:uncharacterized repeat protein (TIGR01451 family)